MIRFPPLLMLALLLSSQSVFAGNVLRCADKIYNSAGQNLSVYLPTHGKKPFPTVITIHGGCFQRGDKKDNLDDITRLTNAGYGVATLNYRLADPFNADLKKRNLYPAAMEDVQDAVRWLREHGRECDLDTHRLVAFGFSAGATLAEYLGTRLVYGSAPHSESSPLSEPVDGVIAFYGRTQFTEGRKEEVHDSHGRDCAEEFVGLTRSEKTMDKFREASVVGNVHAISTCFLIENGDADGSVNMAHGQLLFQDLTEKSLSSQPIVKISDTTSQKSLGPHCYDELDIIRGADHGFVDPKDPSQSAMRDQAWVRVYPFLKEVLPNQPVEMSNLPANTQTR